MSEKPRQYRIETIADFDHVPTESLAACLEDFAHYLAIRRLAHAMLDPEQAKVTDGFTWVDDGIAGVSSVTFCGPDGEVVMAVNLPEES